MAEQLHSNAGITWGKVIGGAAIATGAVVVIAAMFPSATPAGTFESISNGLKDFFNWVASGFQSTPTPPAEGAAVPAEGAAPAEPPKPGFFTTNLGKGLIGAATMGGGYALLSHSRGKQEENAEHASIQAAATGQREGFAVREQMRAMQGLMQARMAATSPEYAAGAGRGA